MGEFISIEKHLARRIFIALLSFDIESSECIYSHAILALQTVENLVLRLRLHPYSDSSFTVAQSMRARECHCYALYIYVYTQITVPILDSRLI